MSYLRHWRWTKRRVMLALAGFTATVSCALFYDVLPPIMTDLAGHFGGGTVGSFYTQLAGARLRER